MTNPDTAIVEGVNVDALAAAVRSCPAVDDLDGGPLGTVATYLPGRRVPGIRIGADRASIQVRGKWDVPIRELAGQVLAAVAPLTGGRTIDIFVADVAEPALPAPTQQGLAGRSRQLGAGALRGKVRVWGNENVDAVTPGFTIRQPGVTLES